MISQRSLLFFVRVKSKVIFSHRIKNRLFSVTKLFKYNFDMRTCKKRILSNRFINIILYDSHYETSHFFLLYITNHSVKKGKEYFTRKRDAFRNETKLLSRLNFQLAFCYNNLTVYATLETRTQEKFNQTSFES